MIRINPNPEALAREFWAGTGLSKVFPRKIEQAIALKLPLALVKLPQLNVHVVEKWLERRRVTVPLPSADRDFLGCLVAYRGRGIIFICGADDLEEQRLTVAHEVAHFLVDYVWPRQQVIQALGEHITDVLDGLRTATPAERAAAILSHVHLGAHLHILPRLGADEELDSVVARVEGRANRLALELVAPRVCIVSLLHNLPADEAANSIAACTALSAYFGLPAQAFNTIVQNMNQRRPVSFLADISDAIRKQR
jgi:hypothetical protein